MCVCVCACVWLFVFVCMSNCVGMCVIMCLVSVSVCNYYLALDLRDLREFCFTVIF